jgi:hypothetical protein
MAPDEGSRDLVEWIETGRGAHGRKPARRARIPWVRSALGSAVVVMGLVELAQTGVRMPAVHLRPAPIGQAIVTAPPAPWRLIERAAPSFSVERAELKDLPFGFEARQHVSGGREDKLVFGVFESEALYVRLALFQGGRDPGAKPGFFMDLARRAGEAGLAVVRSAQPSPLATKFGDIEAAEVVLADGLERRCLAFRVQHADSRFSGHGWYCGASSVRSPEPRELACLIDGLKLQGVAEDQALKALFAEAERRRVDGCGPRLADGRRKTT